MDKKLIVGGVEIPPGKVERIEIPLARLSTRNMLSLPVTVIHGRQDGPRIWINAGLHGDETNGVEIVRQVVEKLNPQKLAGAVLAAPVVNVFGFISESRYLPDGRDLNRSFPGTRKGSLAAQIAHLFLEQIASPCQLGIDLHTGTRMRENLPQIRAILDDPETRRYAQVFGAPVTLHASLREGSLRQAASQLGIRVLVYEGGEAQRLCPAAVKTGVTGILRVLAALGMRTPGPAAPKVLPLELHRSRWIRARRTGLLRLSVELGERLSGGQKIGVISDVLGDESIQVEAPLPGIVLGISRNPLVNKGDGVVHLGLQGHGRNRSGAGQEKARR